MQITGLKRTIVTVPFRKPEYWAWGSRPALTNTIIEIETDEGITGLGEAPSFPGVEFVTRILEDGKRFLIGEDPFNVERIMRRLYGLGGWHHYRTAANSALAGIEMALWDIIGKACNQPVHRLMGGVVNPRVRFMYFLVRQAPEAMAEEAVEAVRQGFDTLYLKVGIEPDLDLAQARAVRKAVGPGPRLRVDANEAWSVGTAVRMISQMKELDLEFVEQPVPAHNLAEMAHVRRVTGVPICANESAWTHRDVFNVITHQAADVIEIDPHEDGGLLAFKKEAALCEAAGLPVAKHSFGELGIATAAALQVMVTCPNFLLASQAYVSFLSDDIIAGGPFRFEQGTLAVPTAPGLGVSIDRDQLARYARYYEEHGAFDAYQSLGPDVIPFSPRF